MDGDFSVERGGGSFLKAVNHRSGKRMDKDVSTQVDIEKVQLREFDDLIALRVVGSHFLRKMVRRIVGIVVEAGRGNFR